MKTNESPVIHKTYNYDMFSYIECNRPIDNTRNLEKSIKQCDLTPYNPIIVDTNYRIIDGQHRYKACINLGLPIYYVICREQPILAMILLNQTQKMWRQEEFLRYHAETKGGCYLDLYEFEQANKLGVSNSVVVYPANQINAKTIKEGISQFDKNPNAEKIVAFLKSANVEVLRYKRTRPFVLAVRIAHERYTDRQLSKLLRKIAIVPMCANYEQYLTAFDNIIR